MTRGLKFYFPLLASLLIALIFSGYAAFLDSPECAFLFGLNVSFLGVLVFCFVLPVTFAIASMYFLYFSIKSWGQDCYPPADIPWIGIFKRRNGKRAQIAKVVGYLLPIFSIWLLWLGISSFIEIADGRTLSEISAVISVACEQ